jgi:hypothetical protein
VALIGNPPKQRRTKVTTSKIALVTLALLLSTVAGTQSTNAAPADDVKNFIIAHGCFSAGAPMYPLPGGGRAFGTLGIDWSENDITTAVDIYGDRCASGDPLSRTKGEIKYNFEKNLRNFIEHDRNLDNQKKAQQVAQIALQQSEEQRKHDQAEKEAQQLLEQTRLTNIEAQKQRDQATKDAQQKQEQLLAQAQRDREAAEDARQQQQARVEFEKTQAASRLAQAEDDAHRKQEQLREQAQRDREAAAATAKLAETEEPKLAEAIKEAEAARHARQAAEQRLAEIRSRIEEQEKARKQQADREAAEQKQKVAQEAAAARQKADQEAAAQANLPINILGTAYASYVDVKRCQEARDGYATIYISNPEMDQARDAVRQIEQTMRSKLDQNITTDDIWSRVATTEGRNFHPSGDYQEGTGATAAAIAFSTAWAPGGHGPQPRPTALIPFSIGPIVGRWLAPRRATYSRLAQRSPWLLFFDEGKAAF